MSDTNGGKGGFLTPKAILALVLVVLALVFVFLNTGTATLNLFGLRLGLPAWVWLIALLAIGFVVGSLFPWFTGKKNRRK